MNAASPTHRRAVLSLTRIVREVAHMTCLEVVTHLKTIDAWARGDELQRIYPPPTACELAFRTGGDEHLERVLYRLGYLYDVRVPDMAVTMQACEAASCATLAAVSVADYAIYGRNEDYNGAINATANAMAAAVAIEPVARLEARRAAHERIKSMIVR